ncbi:blue-light sensor BLUF [Sphingobium sp. C100]|jgi:hypothetical protein|uniref:BLUF domain-containing protein n=1 Tax=Sphingobium sp. C100 TaxID=1207055 RepID=UPI0003D6731D|nr:BLUF domain-containing protein [Sphingobium sp. C100]ETI61053.1 blue-light sensor BLUF [Sphingobium sp. C100]
MLSTWLYTSICTVDPADGRAAVQAIVAISRLRNSALDVTGALVWTGRRFAQFLEGPAAGIGALRESIEQDARHREVWTLEASQASGRMFDGWSLAYSGTASYVERELQRISARAAANAADSARDLKLLLVEFARMERD